MSTFRREMPLEHDQESIQDRHDSSAPVQSVYSSKRSLFRRPSAPPPPYTSPSTPNASVDFPPHSSSRSTTPTQNRPEVPSRPLPPPPPRPRIATLIEQQQSTANPGQSEPSPRATTAPFPLPASSPATHILSSHRTTPLSPQPHVNSPSQFLSPPSSIKITKSRSLFRPFSSLKPSKATRNATTQIAPKGSWKAAEEARYQAGMVRLRVAEEEAVAREREEEVNRLAEARETVKSCIQSLLLSGHPSEESRISVFSTCFQACKGVGLHLPSVLQEPLIEGQTPVYWAILNRPATTSEVDTKTSDAVITALLNACGSLKETTISSVRLACMLISNNALLQHLFWNFPELSPLSMKDRMLLGPSGGGDIVEVDETQDGSGAFIAHMKIRRFRLRMNVSAIVKLEFVTFGRLHLSIVRPKILMLLNAERIWTATFSASTEHTPGGPSENKRLFSLELAKKSMPAYVNAELCVSGHSHQDNTSDSSEPIFSVAVGGDGHALEPGPGNAIRVRLDHQPMGLHWVNEFVNAHYLTDFCSY